MKTTQPLFGEAKEPSTPVECLGQTFANDDARREYFLELLREKLADPAFRGEVEVRVHPQVLRIAGSYRVGRAIKDGRVRLPLKDIAFVRSAASRVDLWLRGDGPAEPLQRLALDLFSDEAARELLQWLPEAQPWPHGDATVAPVARSNASVSPLRWAAVIGIALAVALVLWLALRHRF